MQECEAFAIEILPILGESSTAIEPCDGTLDDPAFGQHCKSFDLIGSPDDFGFEVGQDFCKGFVEFRISAPGSQRRQATFSRTDKSHTELQEAEYRRRDLEHLPDERWRGAKGLMCRPECAASCP